MADVRPFPALRYAPDVDLATALCPPFDTISPEQQRRLYDLSPHNAVRLELAREDGDRYRSAAKTLHRWLDEGVLRRDAPALYVYDQRFRHGDRSYRRRLLFARLRLEAWERGLILPHEATFGGPKKDRLALLRATRLNTSPVLLLYRDPSRRIEELLDGATVGVPVLEFDDAERETQRLWRAEETAGLTPAFEGETLYVADGHHRYETALAYREERRAASPSWTGDEPENFALAALVSAWDPGLLVLPIHRLTSAAVSPEEALRRLGELFQIEPFPSPDQLLAALPERRDAGPTFGLVAAGSPCYLLTLTAPAKVERLLPQGRSPDWQRLDASVATFGILQHGLGLSEEQLADYATLWFTGDSDEALNAVANGAARYAVLLNPVPVQRILDIADAGERMPQKTTFFYPKVPTGIVFNPLDA